MKVLLTGATGFIGRHVAGPLLRAGAEIHAPARHPPAPGSLPGPVFHRCDLLDEAATAALVEALRPTHLVHCAWVTEPGAVWWHEDNLRWVGATLSLFQAFAAAGGRRAVVAGTCAEYDWSGGDCTEEGTPLRPATLYGAAKHATHVALAPFAARAGVSLCWARPFHMFGPFEDERRLVGGAFAALLRGEPFASTDGRQLRDFLHVADVGAALAALLRSGTEGAVNVASGRSVPVETVLRAVARAAGRPDLLRLGARPRPRGDPDWLRASTDRLRATGWQPSFTLASGIADTEAWWRDRLGQPPHPDPARSPKEQDDRPCP